MVWVGKQGRTLHPPYTGEHLDRALKQDLNGIRCDLEAEHCRLDRLAAVATQLRLGTQGHAMGRREESRLLPFPWVPFGCP